MNNLIACIIRCILAQLTTAFSVHKRDEIQDGGGLSRSGVYTIEVDDYTDKTKFMLIQGPTVKGRKTTNYKYLGLIMDDNLNWNLHINELCTKLSSVCGVLSKVRHYLDRKSLMLIYHSLF